MFSWFLLIALMALLVLGGLVYISFRAANLGFVKKLAGGRRWLGRTLCLVFFAAAALVMFLVWNMMNALVVILHLVVFWIICDLIALIIRKLRHKQSERYFAGGVAIILCVSYLCYGWYADHRVIAEYYSFTSSKVESPIRVVQLTDSHLGATFHADKLAEYMEEINALEPDIIVVTGDFVDDDTSREDMLAGCEALGLGNAAYGTYFVYGNHDKGYYSEEAKGWNNSELVSALEENGVIILEDESALVRDDLYISGRQDRSEEQRGGSRLTAQELLGDLDHEKYILLLDHQPYDFDNEAEAGADLVLCGHTHGGQFIPINRVGMWIGENCLNYGHEKRLDTDFIVSSGISNWTFKFKTGCHSEYVVADIVPED